MSGCTRRPRPRRCSTHRFCLFQPGTYLPTEWATTPIRAAAYVHSKRDWTSRRCTKLRKGDTAPCISARPPEEPRRCVPSSPSGSTGGLTRLTQNSSRQASRRMPSCLHSPRSIVGALVAIGQVGRRRSARPADPVEAGRPVQHHTGVAHGLALHVEVGYPPDDDWRRRRSGARRFRGESDARRGERPPEEDGGPIIARLRGISSGIGDSGTCAL